MDSNHGPRPYQGRALTKLSYAPTLNVKYDIPFSFVVKRKKGTIPIKKSFKDNLKLSTLYSGRTWIRTMDLVLIRDAL